LDKIFELIFVAIIVFTTFKGLVIGFSRSFLLLIVNMLAISVAWFFHEKYPYLMTQIGFRDSVSKLVLFTFFFLFINGLGNIFSLVLKKKLPKLPEFQFVLLAGLFGFVVGLINSLFTKIIITENIPFISEKIKSAFLIKELLMFEKIFTDIFQKIF